LSYLFDTDHITILQRQAGSEFAAIMVHIAEHLPSEFAFSIISLHEQAVMFQICTFPASMPY
jgi:tRNA(fMet)-specific endonuclease VapC